MQYYSGNGGAASVSRVQSGTVSGISRRTCSAAALSGGHSTAQCELTPRHQNVGIRVTPGMVARPPGGAASWRERFHSGALARSTITTGSTSRVAARWSRFHALHGPQLSAVNATRYQSGCDAAGGSAMVNFHCSGTGKCNTVQNANIAAAVFMIAPVFPLMNCRTLQRGHPPAFATPAKCRSRNHPSRANCCG